MAEFKIHVGTGENRKTYALDRETILNTEFIAIERATGFRMAELFAELAESSMVAITAVVWILRCREEPGLRFEDVQFAISELDLEEPAEEPEDPKEVSADGTPPEQS